MLSQLGASFKQVPEWDFDTLTIPKSLVTAEDKVDAFKAGLFFIEEGDGKTVRMARSRLVLAFIVPNQSDPKVASALKELGVKPGRERYVFRPLLHAAPGFKDPYAIWVTARSMMDVINLTSFFVNVPDEHKVIVPEVVSRLGLSSLMSKIEIKGSPISPPWSIA